VHIRTGEFFGILIPYPPIDEQEKIHTMLSAIDHRIVMENQKVSNLRFVKNALMQDLLTGKVRVPLP
jgi:type I restriction enzyme S subunit